MNLVQETVAALAWVVRTARLYRMVHWFGGAVLVGDLVREEEGAGITSAD